MFNPPSYSLPDLVNPERALQNAALATANSSNPSLVTSLISAASGMVRRICNRDFTQASYMELYQAPQPGTYEPLRLRQFPVTEITRVATYPVQALQVSNSGATAQRATVETLSDNSGIKLVWQINGGTLQSQTLTYASNATLSALATAITAVGNGFSATVYGSVPNIDLTKAASSDLWPLQGAMSVIGSGSYLLYYAETVPPFGNYPGDWGDDPGYYTYHMVGWRLDNETGELYGRFPRGQQQIRIDYAAGFSPIPQDVQEATVQIVKYLYDMGTINHGLQRERLGDAAREISQFRQLPPSAQILLSPYQARDKVMNRN